MKPARDLDPKVTESSPGRAVVRLGYPKAVENEDLTWRPRWAHLQHSRVQIDGRRATTGRGSVSSTSVDVRGTRLVIEGRPGQQVTIPKGALRDRHGNRSGEALSFEL